jgi:hypothetical protein
MTDLKVVKLSDLKPDQRNANKGTERGAYMLEHSLREYGAGRSILIDRDGNIVAGNKTAEEAAALGLEEVIVVPTDGRQLVAVQRTDLDLYADERARLMAYADNRSQDVSLDWDGAAFLYDIAEGLDLSALFFDDEIEAIVEADRQAELQDGAPDTRALGDQKKQIKPVLYADDVMLFERAIRATGLRNRGEALIEICRAYLGDDLAGLLA